jgi:hypothetical protein
VPPVDLPREELPGTSRGRRAACISLLGLLAVAALLRLAVAWGDLSVLVRDATPDDAYYYFQIAHQLASGHGPSLDGETPTNGFHPLWLLLLLPGAATLSDPLLALRVGLTLGALLAVANVGWVYALLRAVGAHPSAALVAAGAYAIHPTVILDSVNGLETSLAVATQGLAIFIFVTLAARPRPIALRGCAGLGVAAGLMLLARTDAVVVFAALLAGIVLREGRAWRHGLAGAFVAGSAATLVVLPWLAWNLATFGSVLQVSATAIPEQLQQAYLASHGSGPAILWERALEVTLRDLARAGFLYLAPSPSGVRRFAAIAAALLALQLLAPAGPARRLRQQCLRLAAPACGILATFLVHTGVRWWTREWYYAPLAFLAALVLGLVLDHAQASARVLAPGRRWPAPALTLGTALLLVAALGPHQRERWGLRSVHRVNQLEAATWIAQHTEPGARVGSFNAGILSYFGRRTVVNLDGAVNVDALRARESGRVLEYVLEKRLGYLADFRSSLQAVGCAASQLAECEALALVGLPVPQFGGRVQILRVRPRAAPPSTGP